MRHVHLNDEAVEKLFGKGAKLTPDRILSQPSQYLCKERVTLVGPKNNYENVAVIGPTRNETQVEISRTDSFFLGVKNVPIRLSGDLEDAPQISIMKGTQTVQGCVIIAKRHIHLDPATAKTLGFKDGEKHSVKFDGDRSATLDNVIVRIDPKFTPAIHIDGDEANAVLSTNLAEII
jgi:propanediol utilization protein